MDSDRALSLGRILGADDGLLDIGSFMRTRRAVFAGEPVHELTREERRARNFMDPWLFNLQESVLAALPTSVLLWFLGVVYGAPPVDPGLTGRSLYFAELSAELQPILATVVIPLTLLATAPLISWASFRPGDGTRAERARNTKTYLYVDGARGLWAQMVLVLYLGLYDWVSRWSPADGGGRLAEAALPNPDVWFWTFSALAAWCLVHEVRIVFRHVPSRLFELNGYDPRVSLLRRVKSDNPGPVARYNVVALFGVGVITLAVSAAAYAGASGAAWILALLKAWLVGG